MIMCESRKVIRYVLKPSILHLMYRRNTRSAKSHSLSTGSKVTPLPSPETKHPQHHARQSDSTASPASNCSSMSILTSLPLLRRLSSKMFAESLMLRNTKERNLCSKIRPICPPRPRQVTSSSCASQPRGRQRCFWSLPWPGSGGIGP